MQVTFADRKWHFNVCRMIYVVFRLFYVTLWFYFLPYIVSIGQYALSYAADAEDWRKSQTTEAPEDVDLS